MLYRTVFLLGLSLSFAYDYEDFKRIDGARQLTEFVQSSPLNVLVFVDKQQCKDEQDDKCRRQRTELEQIRAQCKDDRIQFALSTDLQLAEQQFNIYGSLPRVLFFRDNYPILYPESHLNTDSLQEWFSETRERLTRTLDDKSFEHDTQAASGGTTGDWFIIFKKSNETRNLIPIVEATAVHFRNRVIFAYVDLNSNPAVQKRFHVFNSPTFLLLKRGKMYRYESASWKQSAFVEFIENGYQKVKNEVIPQELGVFSSSFENVFKIIPFYLIVIPMVCLTVVLIFLICGFRKKQPKKTTNERVPFQVKID